MEGTSGEGWTVGRMLQGDVIIFRTRNRMRCQELWAVLDAAGLSFLGLGPPETSPEWGVMLQKALRYVQGKEQWIELPPGIAISLTVLAFNLFGDGLRDAFDPRQAK